MEGIITQLFAKPRRPDRYEVYLDKKSFATVSGDTVLRYKLRVGLLLEEAMLETLQKEAGMLKTFDRALLVLGFRNRSILELKRNLLQKKEPKEYVEAAIEKLIRLKFLDDDQYARQFSRSKFSQTKYGKRRVAYDLTKRGVPYDRAKKAIQEVFMEEEIDETAILQKVAEKKLRTLSRFDEQTKRRRLYAFLVRRGFDAGEISRSMRKLCQKSSSESL